MNQIKAFVAHSFLDNDKELVGTFLEYLDQIKQMGIGFIWDHAKAAEPKELAQKVLAIIQDKNLLIGICTKNELVVRQADLKRGLLKKHYLGAHEDKYVWKTSDWIIQEIGLAIGRDMDLILLIEDDVRLPGGLQGNREYIKFTRGSVEQSFGRILEMISSLKPKATSAPALEMATQDTESQAEEGSKEDQDWLLHPKADWQPEHYRIAFIVSLTTDNVEAQQVVTKAYLESPDGREPQNKESWESFTEYERLRFGKGGTLDNMLELASSYPENAQVQLYLGTAYEVYKDFEKASAAFNLAAEKATDEAKKMRYLESAASAFYHAGKKPDYQGVIYKMKQEVARTGLGESNLIAVLQKIATLEADNDTYFALAERVLAIKPDDIKARFNLAYKYSEGRQEELSLFHYLRIPENQRGEAAWNNLGVQYEHFELNSNSIKAYRTAERMGETLAMHNLSRRLIDVGFLDEASEICDRALKIKDYHKNIGTTIARIRNLPEQETKKEKELVDKTLKYSEFYKACGKALIATEPPDYAGFWDGPKCRLRIEIKGHTFTAEGKYESAVSNSLYNLASRRLGGLYESSTTTPTRWLVRYSGDIVGRTVKASISEVEEDKEATSAIDTLLTSTPTREALLVIAESFTEIQVYEKKASEGHIFYTLKKASD